LGTLRVLLMMAGLAVLAVGPVAIFTLKHLLWRRATGFLSFLLVAVVVCSAAYWVLFSAAEYVLYQQFQSVVPEGEWSPTDEASWTDSQRRVVDSYFGDGGRNVLALLAPLLLAANAMAVWALSLLVNAVFPRRTT
jgi:hypothetical protein